MREWLKELRVENNFTQLQMAEKLGMTQQYYNMIENGERQKSLYASVAKKLSDIFGVSFEYICKKENEKEKENEKSE